MKKPLKFAERAFIILVRPESPENIGLVARAMKNTGFMNMRLVGLERLDPASWRTAVHAEDVLERTAFFRDLPAAVADLQTVFGTTARPRQNYSVLGFDEAISKMMSSLPTLKTGLVFGNERTGLTSAELAHSNFRFSIPQASRQPSYNLAGAVLITLFEFFRRLKESTGEPVHSAENLPLPASEQIKCINLILKNLEKKRFIHPTNKRHTTEMIHDLLGRLAMTDRDRRLLLALFSQVDEPGRRP